MSGSKNRVLAAALLGALAVLGAVGAGWFCLRAPGVRYLPEGGGAEWILYPAVVNARAQPLGERTTAFRRSFRLESPADSARLRVCAPGDFAVFLDGTEVASAAGVGRDWKRPTEADLGPLSAGEHQVSVRASNDNGHPALWLALTAGDFRLASDEQWEASLLGAVPLPARLASAPPALRAGNSLAGGERTFDSLRERAGTVLLFAALSAGVLGAGLLAARRGWLPRPWLVPAGLVLAWLALFANNVRALPFAMGFDVQAHLDYVRHVHTRASLPLAKEGWEMHQTPLYYVAAALALAVSRQSVDQPGGLLVVRGLTLAAGLAQFLLVGGCLRRVFPGRPVPQLAGLVVAAFLPMHLYLAHYPANDLAAGALSTAAVYLALTVLQSERPSLGRLVGLGVCLGAAVLAKLTALAVVLVVPAVLAGQLVVRRSPVREWARVLGVPVATCLATCGWFFARNVYHFGTPLIGSFDPASGFRWWQDPGFATATRGLRFGRSLTDPFYAAFAGLPDGLYSTLWGDGQWGGTITRDGRPPWNYDLMAAGYLLALVPTALALVGAGAALAGLVRRPRAEWFLLAGLPAAAGAAILYQYLKYPYFCHVKAFYALPAAASSCACCGWGFDAWTRRGVTARLVAGCALGTWALTAYASFWVDGGSPEARARVARQHEMAGDFEQALACLDEAQRVYPDNRRVYRERGFVFVATGRKAEAAGAFEQVVRLAPGDADGHYEWAAALAALGREGQALEQVEQAIRLGPDHPAAYELLATLRFRRGEWREGIAAAREGLRVNPTAAGLHAKLASALAASGATDQAVMHYQIALQWQPDAFLALVGLARLRATNADGRFRDGPQALELALRASRLTPGQDPVLLDTLAAAYAETGQFREAERVLGQAIGAAAAVKWDGVVAVLRQRLEAYRRGEPLREKPGAGWP